MSFARGDRLPTLDAGPVRLRWLTEAAVPALFAVFALGRAHWGRGYMAAALPAVLGFAFEGLGLHRVFAEVDPRNTPSLRRLERLGFRREGVLREHYLVGGEWQDGPVFGLLRSEWLAHAEPGAPGVLGRKIGPGR